MFSNEAIELIRLIPMSIKVDILKEELNFLYNMEVKADEIIKKHRTSLQTYMRDNSYVMVLDRAFLNEFIEKYNTVGKMSAYFDISEDRKKELYYWAKCRRKELGLKDNIFNIYEGFIGTKNRHEKLNEEINKRKSL